MLMTTDTITPASEAELATFVADSAASRRRLRIQGGGTRGGTPVQADATLSTAGLSGVVDYEPGALTLIVRTGTPLDEVTRLLASEGQALAFEPMDHRVLLGSNGTPTIGGMVAANVSGPRRLQAGACRDHVLGVRFVDGRGRIIKNGGRVMKNVTGMDLGKLMSGAHGTLGVLTEVSLKTLPVAEAQSTLAFPGVTAADAVRLFSTTLATPFEVTGAAFHDGTAWLRIEGLGPQVAYRLDRIAALFPGQRIDVVEDADSAEIWRGLRDLSHLADSEQPVWRIAARPSDAPGIVAALTAQGGQASLDWGGGLIWYAGPAPADAVRHAAANGTAILVRPGASGHSQSFPPALRGVAALAAAMRRTFDPAGILNPDPNGT